MTEINRNTSALVIIAIFITYPFISAMFFNIIRIDNTTNFSIYNDNWNGVSEFKQRFEDRGGEISTIVGSSNVLNRLNTT